MTAKYLGKRDTDAAIKIGNYPTRCAVALVPGFALRVLKGERLFVGAPAKRQDGAMAIGAGAVRQLGRGRRPGERELERCFEPERQPGGAPAGVG